MSLPPKVNIEYARALLIRKEKLVKPASVAMRHQIIQAQNRSAYMNEYDRIQGIISGYAGRFAGKHNIQQLKNKQSNLKGCLKSRMNTITQYRVRHLIEKLVSLQKLHFKNI